jgi:hypothetical protein
MMASRSVVEAEPQCGLTPTYGVLDAIEMVDRVLLARDELTICFAPFGDLADNDAATQITIPWSAKAQIPTSNGDPAQSSTAIRSYSERIFSLPLSLSTRRTLK